MPSKKKGKNNKQTKSIVTPKVNGKKLVEDKNTEPDLAIQSADLEINLESNEPSEVENIVEENTVNVIDPPSEKGEISKEEIVICPDDASEEKEQSDATSSEDPEPNNDTDKFPTETDTIKKDKKKKKSSKSEAVKLVGTSYHYFRGWLKNHLSDAGIKGFRFIKDDVGWQGYISIPSDSFEAAMKALQEFKNNQPEGTKDLFW